MANTLTLSWSGGRSGAGRIASPRITGDLAMPAAHGGTGAGLDPKNLLAAAAAECLLLNLVAVLEASGVEHGPVTLETAASGDGSGGIAIAHRISLHLPAGGAGDDHVARLVEKAEAGCGIGNLLKSAGVAIEISHSPIRS